jgi:hypothetical protein
MTWVSATRENQTLVITVNHHHNTERTGRQTPGVLPDEERILLLTFLGRGILNGNTEHLTEVLAKTVGCTTLDTASSSRDVTFDGGSVEATSELLLLGLLTLDNGDSEKLLINLGVPFENDQNFFAGSSLCKVCGVTSENSISMLSLVEGPMRAQYPSCHKNSLVRRKGWGFLNSQRTTEFHWLRRRGRSRWLRIHLA